LYLLQSVYGSFTKCYHLRIVQGEVVWSDAVEVSVCLSGKIYFCQTEIHQQNWRLYASRAS